MNNTIMSILTERAKEEGTQPQDFINNYLNQKNIDKEKINSRKEKTINILKKLNEIHKNLMTVSKPQDILKECFKRAGVEMPKYISYISKIDLLDIIHQNDRLTFNLKNMENLQDLKVYLIEHQGLNKIGIYDQKKNKFIIEKNSFISKENIKIKGYLIRIESKY